MRPGGWTMISATVPAAGLSTGISIFIDSMMITSWPAFTRSPTLTRSSFTVPVMGAGMSRMANRCSRARGVVGRTLRCVYACANDRGYLARIWRPASVAGDVPSGSGGSRRAARASNRRRRKTPKDGRGVLRSARFGSSRRCTCSTGRSVPAGRAASRAIGHDGGWVEEDAARARVHWQKGPDNTADLAERPLPIFTPEGVYSANLDSDDDPSFRLPPDGELCLPQAPSLVLALVVCGFLDFGGPDYELSVEQSAFEGKATVSLVGKYPMSSPVGSEEFPHGGPARIRSSWRRNTASIASTLSGELPPDRAVSPIDSDPDRKVFGGVSRFETEFVPRSSLSKDWFEPHRSLRRAGGGGASALEDPKLETPGVLAGAFVYARRWPAPAHGVRCERYSRPPRGSDSPTSRLAWPIAVAGVFVVLTTTRGRLGSIQGASGGNSHGPGAALV